MSWTLSSCWILNLKNSDIHNVLLVTNSLYTELVHTLHIGVYFHLNHTETKVQCDVKKLNMSQTTCFHQHMQPPWLQGLLLTDSWIKSPLSPTVPPVQILRFQNSRMLMESWFYDPTKFYFIPFPLHIHKPPQTYTVPTFPRGREGPPAPVGAWGALN